MQSAAVGFAIDVTTRTLAAIGVSVFTLAMTAAALVLDEKPLPPNKYRGVKGWLYVLAGLVFLIVLVGGSTRLTDSGLSITEWQPLLGAIPPLSDAQWQIAFDKYKLIPEFQVQNSAMNLSEFKYIFWWEWGHRQLGRFIGVVFLLPFLFFAATKRLDSRLAVRLIVLFLLGALQAALGWYMVKSGLADRTDVSQYRLAAHLTLASLLYAAIFWTAFGVGKKHHQFGGLDSYVAAVLLLLVFVQIAAGGFVAGLDAGHASNTWPKMDGAWIPDGLTTLQPIWMNAFENALAVQFNHRIIAYTIFLLAIWHAWRSFSFSSMVLLYTLFVQVSLGIATVLMNVKLGYALTHQGVAMIVLAAAVWNLHRQMTIPEPVADLQ
jgi:cytochrome c oxidase assembly protein subunit 15